MICYNLITIHLFAPIAIVLLSIIKGGTSLQSPEISYFDGYSALECCQSRLERRVHGLSGLLISHQYFGKSPYTASKNCFLSIVVPDNYRIRLRVLDFNVLGDARNCDRDTLHVFDHEVSIEYTVENAGSHEELSPGPIIGQFCGNKRNNSTLSISSQNALTLWWHTDAFLPLNHDGEGFRLLWSAFRLPSRNAGCSVKTEFKCGNDECIPIELACNRYPDCLDDTDLLFRGSRNQVDCDQTDNDIVSSLSGLDILLICIAFVTINICFCICLCICSRCLKDSRRNINSAVNKTENNVE